MSDFLLIFFFLPSFLYRLYCDIVNLFFFTRRLVLACFFFYYFLSCLVLSCHVIITRHSFFSLYNLHQWCKFIYLSSCLVFSCPVLSCLVLSHLVHIGCPKKTFLCPIFNVPLPTRNTSWLRYSSALTNKTLFENLFLRQWSIFFLRRHPISTKHRIFLSFFLSFFF